MTDEQQETRAGGELEEEGVEKFTAHLTKLVEKQAEAQAANQELTHNLAESITAAGRRSRNIGDPQGPSTVRAAQLGRSRPPVYRFDGSGESLVRDAWLAARERDDDAMERIRSSASRAPTWPTSSVP